MATAHISASTGDFAETVLMPGDPKRAKLIADNYLDNAELVTDVRGMMGFTGTFRGKRLSVMGSGMGIPSMSIYAHELYSHFDVENIIRIGSCGAIQTHVNMYDIVIAMGATTDSNVNVNRLKGRNFAAIASYPLLESVVNAARKSGKPFHVGNIYTSDLFYDKDEEVMPLMTKHSILAVEMEAAGLYGVAAELGKNAVAMCTVSDHLINNEALTSEERETSFKNMIEVALESVLLL